MRDDQNRSPAALPQMDGPFPLTAEAIDEQIARISPGNYALGYMDSGTFVVFYVGRSDSDVKCRLHEWVCTPGRTAANAPSGRASWGVHRRGTLSLNAPALEGRSGIAAYTHFAYRYARSAEAAYAEECRNYDDFGGRQRRLDNSAAPCALESEPAPPVSGARRRGRGLAH